MNDPAPMPTRRGFLVPLVLAGTVVVLDTSVMVIAIPVLIDDFHSSLPVLQWVTTGYLLGLVAVLPTAAWLMARLGPRTVFIVALGAFIVLSGAAAFSWSVESLVAARILQGLGGGLIAPASQTIALGAVPRERRGRVMGVLGIPVLFGPLVGPVLAGWIIDTASWRPIFAVDIPIGIAGILLALRLLPRTERPAPTRLDWLGLALLSAGSVLLVLALTLLAESGPTAAGIIAALAGSASMTVFVVRTLGIDHPLLRLRLLRSRSLATGSAVAMIYSAAYFGGLAVLPLYVQAVRGDPAVLAGSLAIPQGLAVGGTMQLATRLVDRVSPRRIIGIALSIGIAGTLALAAAVAVTAPYPVIVACTVAFGIGSGGTLMPAMTAATRDLPAGDLPSGTTLLGLGQQLATGLGIALVTLTLVTGLDTVPVTEGAGFDRLIALSAGERNPWLDQLGAAVAVAYLLVAGLMICALAVTLIALREPRADGEAGHPGPSTPVETGSRSALH